MMARHIRSQDVPGVVFQEPSLVPAHGQDPEHRRIPGLDLVDRTGRHLGLPVCTLVAETVAYRLQCTDMMSVLLEGFRGECP